jgi:nucleoid DNA-binding protein
VTRRVFDGQLAHEIAGEDEARYERVRAVARNLLDIVREGLLRDGEVRVHGFGTFRLQRSAERTGRDPRTGEPMTIPARNRVLFRPAKALRERVEPHRAPTILAEPQPSREASLGDTSSSRRLWPVPATNASAAPRSRASDASPAEPSAQRPGSREAALATGAHVRERAAGSVAVAQASERVAAGGQAAG